MADQPESMPVATSSVAIPLPRVRPTGITILAWLYLIGGVVMLGMLLLLFNRLGQGFDSIGISAAIAQFSISLLGLLAAAAGIGMLTGKNWGWWLGAFYLVWSVTRNTTALLAIQDIAAQFDVPPERMALHYVKAGTRIIFHSLLCWYFFSSRVEHYFDVVAINRWMRLLFLVAAAIILYVLFAIPQVLAEAA